MLTRSLAILGILLALVGVIIAPGFIARNSRKKPQPIHRLHPDDGDVPWDLTGWIPVGFLKRDGVDDKSEWKWMPKFQRIK